MSIHLIFILSFIFRLVSLNQSLWLDEAIVAKVIKTIPLFQIPFQFSPGDFHPPLYYLFMSLWENIFGYSEIALRMPSILFSLIAGWYVFKITSLIKDKKTGLWAVTFFLCNPLIVYYSQEARMYMMTTALLTIALYYFLRVSLRTKYTKTTSWLRNDVVLFNLFSALAMFTFYGSVFFIVGMLVMGFFALSKKRASFFLSIGLLVSSLLLSPLLFQQLQNARIGLLEVKNWSLVLGKAEVKNFAMVFLKFATGRLSWYPKWSYYLVAGGGSLVVGICMLLGMKRNKMLAALFIMPLLFGFIISFWAPMMQYFRFLYLIPVMSILLALGITKRRISISTGVLILFLLFSFTYLFNPQFHREDWKKMVQGIDPTQPVYMILPSSDPVSYYNPTLSLFEIRKIQNMTLPERLQVIPYVEELYGYNHSSVLEKKGCMRETLSEYRGPLFLEKWKCPPLFIGHTSVSTVRKGNKNNTSN